MQVTKMTKKELIELIDLKQSSNEMYRSEHTNNMRLLGKVCQERDALRAQNMHLKKTLHHQIKASKNLLKGI